MDADVMNGHFPHYDILYRSSSAGATTLHVSWTLAMDYDPTSADGNGPGDIVRFAATLTP